MIRPCLGSYPPIFTNALLCLFGRWFQAAGLGFLDPVEEWGLWPGFGWCKWWIFLGFVMDWYGFWSLMDFGWWLKVFLWILGQESATVFGGTSGVETNPSNFVGSRCACTKLVSTKTHCRFMKYHSHRPWPWRTRCRLTLHCQRCGSTGFAAWVCPRENPRPDVFADRGSQHPTCFYRSIFPMGHG